MRKQPPFPFAAIGSLLCASYLNAGSAFNVIPAQEPERHFCGEPRRVSVLLRNTGDQPASAQLYTRLYQASSATTMLLNHTFWKDLSVLPGQTVVESATLSFPVVKAETRFVVQWLEGTNKVIGTTDVLAYPRDLLKGLKPAAGEEPLGILDPENLLKPLLKAAAVSFLDLEDAGFESFSGKLAILSSLQPGKRVRNELTGQMKALARKGTGVVWLRPAPGPREVLTPSFHALSEGKGTIVVVQRSLIPNLAENPQSQLNLIGCARLALHPDPLRLPDFSP